MNKKKILCVCAVLLSLWTLTSCEKVAEEILDLAGANTFKEADTLIQQDGDTKRNVLSATIKGEVGDKVYLYIGNISTKQASSYSKAKWTSDEPAVAAVGPDTGNSTTVSLLEEGTALIIAKDNEGNMLTTTIVVEDNRLRFSNDDAILDEEGTALSMGLHIAKTCYVGQTYTLRLANASNPEEDGNYARAKWTQEDKLFDGTVANVVWLSTTEGGTVEVAILEKGSSRIRAIDDFGNTLYCDLHCQEDTGGYDDDEGGYGDDEGGEGVGPGPDIDVFEPDDVLMDAFDNKIISGTTVTEHVGNYIDVFIGDRTTKQPDYLRNITWTSSDTDVASFSNDNGYKIRVEIDAQGTSIITATDETGNTLAFTLKVAN